MLESNSGR